jgi:hypothetical protein
MTEPELVEAATSYRANTQAAAAMLMTPSSLTSPQRTFFVLG